MASKTDIQVLLCENYDHLCDTAAQTILSLSNKAIQTRGRFTVSLAGSYTPKGLFRLMSGPSYENLFNWQKMHFFWGDERWVPPDDHKSNYRMVAETLIAKVDIPVENIHPIRTRESSPDVSAQLYEKELRSFFDIGKDEIPRFDLALLGLGQDGHVASLFPGDPALDDKDRLVVGVSPEQTVEQRISFTLPLINESRCIIFMVSGSEKAKALQMVLEDKDGGHDLPAGKVQPRRGSVFWIVDRQAASLLNIKKMVWD